MWFYLSTNTLHNRLWAQRKNDLKISIKIIRAIVILKVIKFNKIGDLKLCVTSKKIKNKLCRVNGKVLEIVCTTYNKIKNGRQP